MESEASTIKVDIEGIGKSLCPAVDSKWLIIYIYIYIHMIDYRHTHKHTYTYVYIYIYIHTHTRLIIYIYIYILGEGVNDWIKLQSTNL